jgi:hypothetical protein
MDWMAIWGKRCDGNRWEGFNDSKIFHSY